MLKASKVTKNENLKAEFKNVQILSKLLEQPFLRTI